jgi:hypothetical protein
MDIQELSAVVQSQIVPSQSYANESQSTVTSSISFSQYNQNDFSRGNVPFVIPGIKSISTSQSKCLVCGSAQGRRRISLENRMDIWVRTRIFVSPGNRHCAKHIENGRLTDESLSAIKVKKAYSYLTGTEVSAFLHALTDLHLKPRKILTFDEDSGLTSGDYHMLLGVSRENFDLMMGCIKGPIKSSKNR